MRVVVINHLCGEQLPIILDSTDLPLTEPNEYLISVRSKSTSTLVRNAREIVVFYEWLQKNNINLEMKLLAKASFNSAQITSSLIEYLRVNRENGNTVAPSTFNLRLMTVRKYLLWFINNLLVRLPYSSAKYKVLSDRKTMLDEWLSASFISAPPSNKHLKKGLSEDETSFLIKILDPTSSNSYGVSEAVKSRNFIAVGLMLYCGLRPGEVLSLRVSDIIFGAISSVHVIRREPDLNDTRKPRPSVKRNGRLLPIGNANLVRNLNEYIVNWREVLEDHSDIESDYLILNDAGTPLSQASITQLFHILRKRYCDFLPENLSAKSLRHTFSSRMERELRQGGMSEDKRRQALALLRGDSSLESQNVYIAQEVDENAREAMSNYQKNLIG